jgi:hypothetical protein
VRDEKYKNRITNIMNNSKSMFTDLKTMLRYYQSLGFDSIPIASEDYENGSVNFTADKGVLLGKIKEEIANCVRCKLSKYRKKNSVWRRNP